jgi:hypothetical protein
MNAAGIIALLGAVCLAEYNSRQIVRDAPLIVVDELPGELNAMCVPPIGIYIRKGNEGNADLIEHELFHWWQFQERGLLPFYFDYATGYLVNGYDQHPMEIEARFNECDYCRQNYTECVRNGWAKTVYNPFFRCGTNFPADLPAGGSLETENVPT